MGLKMTTPSKSLNIDGTGGKLADEEFHAKIFFLLAVCGLRCNARV